MSRLSPFLFSVNVQIDELCQRQTQRGEGSERELAATASRCSRRAQFYIERAVPLFELDPALSYPRYKTGAQPQPRVGRIAQRCQRLAQKLGARGSGRKSGGALFCTGLIQRLRAQARSTECPHSPIRARLWPQRLCIRRLHSDFSLRWWLGAA